MTICVEVVAAAVKEVFVVVAVVKEVVVVVSSGSVKHWGITNLYQFDESCHPDARMQKQ